MARGTVVAIPNLGHKQVYVPAGGVLYPSITILNPNDGVVYVAANRDLLDTSIGSWDYKVPSQSYALLPGPWQSAGLFYLDQSGAGRTGEISMYPLLQQVEVPQFMSIGRALLATLTTLDIAQSTIPANPSLGFDRLWVDANDVLHVLNSAGVDESDINTRTVLGGVLSGFMPNPTMAAGAALANLAANSITKRYEAIGSTAFPTTTSTAFVTIPEMTITITTNGGDLLCWLYHAASVSAGGPGGMYQGIALDGSTITLAAATGPLNQVMPICVPILITSVSAGSHTITGTWACTAAGMTLTSDAARRQLIVVEILR